MWEGEERGKERMGQESRGGGKGGERQGNKWKLS